MANCGNCGQSQRLCSCFLAPDGMTTEVIGNGNLSTPYAVRPTFIPDPRPLGHIGRVDGDSDIAISQNTHTRITHTTNYLIRQSNSVDGGMTNLGVDAGRLTVAVAGKYIVGGSFIFTGILNDPGSVRRDVRVSRGTPAGANVYASTSHQAIWDNPNQPEQPISCMSYVNLSVGDYLELWVFTTRATETSTPNGSAQLWAVWMGP